MSDAVYSARWKGPTLIEKGKAQTVSLTIEKANAAPSISAATCTIYKPTGETLKDAATATISSGTVSLALVANDTSAESLGAGWLIKFDCTIGSNVYTFYNDGCLSLGRLYPPVGHSDLVGRHSDIANLLASGVSSLQPYIEDAWADITNRAYSESVPFWRLRTSSAFRAPMFSKCFALIFRDYATLMSAQDRYMQLADYYEHLYEKDYQSLRSRLDNDEDNTVSTRQQPVSSVIMLSSRNLRGSIYQTEN